jgi:hypothetical protein
MVHADRTKDARAIDFDLRRRSLVCSHTNDRYEGYRELAFRNRSTAGDDRL